MIHVSAEGMPALFITGCPAVEPTVQALWLDGYFRAADIPAPWGYLDAPSRRALAAWREGWQVGLDSVPRLHGPDCTGLVLDEKAETLTPCSVCCPDTTAHVVAS